MLVRSPDAGPGKWATIMDLREAIESFITEVEPDIAAWDPHLVLEARSLLEHGEWGLAFEQLLQALEDVDLVLDDDRLQRAAQIQRECAISSMMVESLRSANGDGSGGPMAIVFTVAHCNDTTLWEFLSWRFDLPERPPAQWSVLASRLAERLNLPRFIRIWGWDSLAARSPIHAAGLLRALMTIEARHPHRAGRLELFTADDRALDLNDALAAVTSGAT